MFMMENATNYSERDNSFRVAVLSLSLTAACCIFSDVEYLKISAMNFASVPTNLARGGSSRATCWSAAERHVEQLLALLSTVRLLDS
mmetsp:Transcript_43932/g.70454  ORF Transcript_43932/g.70454 Transcript_43932/m.70454 type:complete len:87 (-) Transcript_43932:289-549(-)